MTAAFWNFMAKGYAKQPIADQASYEHKLEKTQTYLKKDMDVLEIGCGTGGTALIHAPHVKHILATDFSQSMIDIAREKASAQNIENVAFECSAIEDLNVAESSKDVILALSILHLLKHRDQNVEKLASYLKPDGILVSSTICLPRKFMPLIWLSRLVSWSGIFPVLRGFSSRDLIRSMENAGLTIDYQWQADGKYDVVFLIAKKP